MRRRAIRAFDFFCGAGGLTKGLTNAGFKVLAGFDIDGASKKSYEFNNRQSKFVEKNIKEITIRDLKAISKGERFRDMLFAGCAPCQPFSQHKKTKDCTGRATLLLEFARLIEDAKPGYVLMENVPGIKNVRGNSSFKRFLTTLKKCNYSYSYDVLDAKYFGVPQNRKRLVLIAVRNGVASLPEPKYGKGKLPFKTVRDSIFHFPRVKVGSSHPQIPNHVAADVTDLNLERLKHTPKNGGDRRSWPEHLILQCHKGNYKGHTDVYGRMHWDNPSPTLTGKCHSISNGRYGHPKQNRAITLREAAALQSFPDDYIFYGSNIHIALQIGNAVPVKLAQSLGKHILTLN